MKKTTLFTLVAFLLTHQTMAFCGFYVAKAGSNLYNNKSEVILVRDGNQTTITMSNDFQGDVKDFAMVVPVPNVLSREDIRIANQQVFSFLDAYSAPRLVEYYDHNPCNYVIVEEDAEYEMILDNVPVSENVKRTFKKEGVTIEAKYDVEEYEILILSATKSEGLKDWLTKNGYKIPSKAERVLAPYIKDKLKFFVVKVNLNKYNPKAHGGFLRPLQIKVNSSKFMLPIRLGMANSKGAQDMIVYAFSKKGKVECTNYRTVNMPTNRNVPTFVKSRFGSFYKDLFKSSYIRQGKDAIFLEYAWNVTPRFSGVKCDPCVGPPPFINELQSAGVHWTSSGQNVFFTRMHVRYTLDKFPEDLFFHETPNQERYQARYVITHPAQGDLTCEEGVKYKKNLKIRRRKELSELTSLTQWNSSKYYKYIEDGTDVEQVVEEEEENLILPVGFNNSGNLPKGPKVFFGILVFILLTYLVNQLIFTRKLAS
jgi:hypothetical protein